MTTANQSFHQSLARRALAQRVGFKPFEDVAQRQEAFKSIAVRTLALAQSYKDISKVVLGDKFEQHSKDLFAQLTKVKEGFQVGDIQSQTQASLSQYVRSMVGDSDDKPGQIPQMPRERMAS